MPEHKSDRQGIAGAADLRTAPGRYQSDGTTDLVLLGVQTSMDGGGLVVQKPIRKGLGPGMFELALTF